MDFGSPGDGLPFHKILSLPDDLPKSLDDRRRVLTDLPPEMELYDGWNGKSQFLTSPLTSQPPNFSDLSLRDEYGRSGAAPLPPSTSDARLMEMLAAQAAHHLEQVQDEDAITADGSRTDKEKKDLLQRVLHTAASNGDFEKVTRIFSGRSRTYVDVNAPDEDGTPPLIYASCFGHEAVVKALIDAGADVNLQDRNQWSALMWAMTNRHKGIAKLLLDRGASLDQRTSSGRTAFDFVAPDSDMSFYLHDSGYKLHPATATSDDFYNPALSQDRFEDEIAENELRRRMMMESARDLEVDLGNVGMDDQPDPADDFEDQQEFDWSRCLLDQMFVFQESELEGILDILITNMTPQRSPSQKPVPANMICLCARYAHYHAGAELLQKLLASAMNRINAVVDRSQWDMTILAFWCSNATLLLHYLKKDAGLVDATVEFQAHLVDLLDEIFVLIVRDAERRLDKVLNAAMLDHETIPGFEGIAFQHEWSLFKRKTQVKVEPLEKSLRPPSPKQRAKPAPRNITSLLSSTLFVLDLYDIHSVITAQIISQLLYWIGAELFNRVLMNRRYLARTKAMQIRMNISVLEDWARVNNRQPEHYEAGETKTSGDTTVDAARHHLSPIIQLLQWLQCFSSLKADDLEALVATLQQLKRLSPQQLIQASNHYRPEVGEKGLPKSAMKYLVAIQKEAELKREARRSRTASPGKDMAGLPSSPRSVATNGHQRQLEGQEKRDAEALADCDKDGQDLVHDDSHNNSHDDDDDDGPQLDPSLMLPFTLPTVTDMLISYGAGFGGFNRERERRYIPTVPPEFLARLEGSGPRKVPMFGEKDWENEVV